MGSPSRGERGSLVAAGLCARELYGNYYIERDARQLGSMMELQRQGSTERIFRILSRRVPPCIFRLNNRAGPAASCSTRNRVRHQYREFYANLSLSLSLSLFLSLKTMRYSCVIPALFLHALSFLIALKIKLIIYYDLASTPRCSMRSKMLKQSVSMLMNELTRWTLWRVASKWFLDRPNWHEYSSVFCYSHFKSMRNCCRVFRRLYSNRQECARIIRRARIRY